MFKKLFLTFLIGISLVGSVFASGIDPNTKLLLKGDGTDASTFVPDSSNYNNYVGTTDKCVLMAHFNGANNATTAPDAATNKAITFVGTAKISTAQSKFGGSSLLLDGDSDRVTLDDSADWTFGSGDFTIETWVYLNAKDAYQTVFAQNDDSKTRTSVMLVVNGANHFEFFGSQGTNWDVDFAGTATLTTGVWYHIAIVRNGDVYTMYKDGTADGTQTVAGTLLDAPNLFLIGAWRSEAPIWYLNGNIQDVVVIKGKALHTANFTPPTVSPSPKDVTCVGNAQIDTAQYKFATGSILFDGTGDYCSLVDSDDWAFGTGNFTIDFWVRFNDFTGNQSMYRQFTGSDEINLSRYNSGIVYFYTYISAAEQMDCSFYWTPDVNTWHHIAVVRYGTAQNNIYIFIDGISQSLSWATNMSANYSFPDIAGIATVGYTFSGWIDEFRISKGVARWTSNFTPPTKAYDTSSDYSGQAIVITQ